MLIEGLVALGSALEAWRRKSAMICWRSANLLSGVGHICAPRRDRPSGRIIPRSTRATTCSRSGGSVSHAECPLKTLHARLTAVSPRSGVGASLSPERLPPKVRSHPEPTSGAGTKPQILTTRPARSPTPIGGDIIGGDSHVLAGRMGGRNRGLRAQGNGSSAPGRPQWRAWHRSG